jgi:formylglycine-generating enzyme required for sulfatase activity
MKNIRFFSALIGLLAVLSSCQEQFSSTTGTAFNDPKTGGFQKMPFVDQETGPGLILVEGGTFTMGRTEEDVMSDWNNRPSRVTVSSFYIDQTEITNFHWCEYMYWISRAYETYPIVGRNVLPDTNSWRSPLGFSEKFVEYYLRHPAYRDYPVVGVSWLQASDYCKWRTDRANEYILIREGILDYNIDQRDENTFNTEAYLAGQYEEKVQQNLDDLNPDNREGKKLGTRIVRLEDGILLPRYRLPTEAEWEFAALGLVGNLGAGQENMDERRIYPWDGHWVRNDEQQFQGAIRANFVRGRGDYMGVAGHLNDGADVTAPVESYWPNDYGLYHMAGNVSEWVLDVYRPMSSEDFDEFRPFRGNIFKTKLLNNAGSFEMKASNVTFDVHGMKEYLNEFERVRFQRVSAAKHDPNDTVIPLGIARAKQSEHPVKTGYAPDPFYVSHGNVKDSVEIELISRINSVIDKAIFDKNNKHDNEANARIQEELFDGIFVDELRVGPNGEEYAFEIISMLRLGFTSFIIDTPGKMKYRDVTEEENIGRLNYRRADYIDYLDGDIESSIYFNNDDVKNKINQASRDPNLIMYQNKYEEFGLDGRSVKPSNKTSWPTTLISDKSRVYKGGSWRDRAYWLAAGNRRFLDEDKSTCTIGFRCCMDRVGTSEGFDYKKAKAQAKAKKKAGY